MSQPLPSLPTRFLRTDTVYRSTSRGRADAVDCGFLLKPDHHHAYRGRVLPRYVAVYVLRGNGVFIDHRGQEHAVDAGCLIQHPPSERHSLIHHPDGRWAEFFFILPTALHAALVRLGCLRASPGVLRPGVEPSLVERCESLLAENRGATERDSPLILARAHELLAALAHRHEQQQATDQHTRTVALACDWLAGDLHRDIDLPAVARRLNLSYERFRKVFRAHTGLPPGEYRIRRRIDRARTLIAQDRLTNKEVAYRLGYPDPFTFSKQFKRYAGMSPDAFRRTL